MADPSREPPHGTADSRHGERLNHRESVEFAEIVGGLVGSGLALPEGLRALAEESESPRLRAGMTRVADRIEGGALLWDAIAAEGPRVPAHLPGLVRAAEQSGRPQQVLMDAVRYERMTAELFRQVLGRLIYPAVLLVAFAIVFQIITRLVSLGFIEIYQDFGISIPSLTMGLIDLSVWIDSMGAVLPVGGMLALFLVWWAAWGATRGSGRRLTRGLPGFGRIGRYAAMAEFSGLLAILVDCRLPMPEALVLAGRGTRDPDLVSSCQGAANEVEQGKRLLDASRTYRLFPQGFDRLLGWAEENDALPDTLRLASELYAARARSSAAILGLFLSVLALTLIVLGIVLVVLGLYLPPLQLLNELTGGPGLFW